MWALHLTPLGRAQIHHAALHYRAYYWTDSRDRKTDFGYIRVDFDLGVDASPRRCSPCFHQEPAMQFEIVSL